MKVFLDISFIIAFLNPKERDHAEANRLMGQLRQRRIETLYVSDFVYVEATTLSVRRYGIQAVRDVESFVSTKWLVQFLRVSPADFDQARDLLFKRVESGLSLTDWTIVVQCESRRIDTILSFDRGFDGIYPRNAIPG